MALGFLAIRLQIVTALIAYVLLKILHETQRITVAPGAHAVLVLDGAGWHGGKDLVVPDAITLLTLPPYAPELNPVENIWQFLRSNKLAITVFDDYDDIVNKCCIAWNFFTRDKAAVTSITSREWATVNQ